jgi:hypothetical protein
MPRGHQSRLPLATAPALALALCALHLPRCSGGGGGFAARWGGGIHAPSEALRGAAALLVQDSPLGASEAVLSLRPTTGQPSTATMDLLLNDASRDGISRLRIFAWLSNDYCGGSVVSATVRRRHGVLTNYTTSLLRTVNGPGVTRRGEWTQLLLDFWLLPQERPAVLRLSLGSVAASHGVAKFAGLLVAPPGPFRNVLRGKPPRASHASSYAPGEPPVPGSVLTNGVVAPGAGQNYVVVDIAGTQTVTIEVTLTDAHPLSHVFDVCSVRAHWLASSQVTQWRLELAATLDGAFVTAAHLRHNVLANNGSSSSSSSSAPVWFPCQRVAKARLSLLSTANGFYGLTELELFGVDVSDFGPCGLPCRHGSSCWAALDTCSCVTHSASWPWRGPRCATECASILRDKPPLYCEGRHRAPCGEVSAPDSVICVACFD